LFTLDFVINAISLGSLYAIIALGLVIVYGILKLVNYAYGELIMIAGYMLFLLGSAGVSPWIILGITAVFTATLVSYLTELVAFRPVRTKSMTAILVTSFAVSTLLQNLVLLIVSPRSRAVPLPALFSKSVNILGSDVSMRNILTIVISLALLGALSLLMKRTILGIALRAAAENFTMTRMLGVPANMVISVAFILSGFLAGVVALFWVGRSASVTPTIGTAPLLIAFVACVIGGMNSLTGAVVGGYIYGIIFSLLSLFLPQSLLDYRDAFMFAIVILILLFKPEGLVKGGYVPERVG
jgi:branched-chain amino acid transport system permease protein